MAIALVAVITAFISISVSNSSNITSDERIRSVAGILTSQASDIKQAYIEARQLGYNQNEILLQTSGCNASQLCLYATNTGSMPQPQIPNSATTETVNWTLLEKTDYRPDGGVNNVCSTTQGASCNFLLLRHVSKDVCMMINHVLHNKPYKEVALSSTSNTWSNPMTSGQALIGGTNFIVSGTDYENITSGCVLSNGPEYIFFTFLDP